MNMSYTELEIKTQSKRIKQNKNDCIDYWNNFDDFFIFLEQIKIIRRSAKWDWDNSSHHLLLIKEENYKKKIRLEPIYKQILNKLHLHDIKYEKDNKTHTNLYSRLYYHIYIYFLNDVKEYIKCSILLDEYLFDMKYKLEVCISLSDKQVEILQFKNIIESRDNDGIYQFSHDIEEFYKLIILLNK